MMQKSLEYYAFVELRLTLIYFVSTYLTMNTNLTNKNVCMCQILCWDPVQNEFARQELNLVKDIDNIRKLF